MSALRAVAGATTTLRSSFAGSVASAAPTFDPTSHMRGYAADETALARAGGLRQSRPLHVRPSGSTESSYPDKMAKPCEAVPLALPRGVPACREFQFIRNLFTKCTFLTHDGANDRCSKGLPFPAIPSGTPRCSCPLHLFKSKEDSP